jgi:hypothetical protein
MSVLLEPDLMVKLKKADCNGGANCNFMIYGILAIEGVPFLQRLLKYRLGTRAPNY